MVDTTYPLFSVFSFLGFILSVVPLPWHLQAWNSGTCYYMMWSSISCLNQFINSIVWAGNIENHSPGWCEISIRIIIAASVGIPCSSLCINRRLYKIASSRTMSFGRSEKVRAIIIDTLICVVFPIFVVALSYVVQGHRFTIYEDIGCYPALFNTILRYFTTSMWPIVIGLISATYCILTLRAFSRRRLEFGYILNSKSSSLSTGRYFRLMAIAMIDIILIIPLTIFTIYFNSKLSPLRPWISWEDTHYNYGYVGQVRALVWKQNHNMIILMEFTRWVTPFCAFIFFAFFGFAEEARKFYSRLFHKIVRPFTLRRKGFLQTSDSTTIGPTSPGLKKLSYLPSFNPPAYANLSAHSSVETTIVDIKRPELVSRHYPIQETKQTPLFSPSSCADSDTICNQRSPKLSVDPVWKTIPVLSERRHSSYF